MEIILQGIDLSQAIVRYWWKYCIHLVQWSPFIKPGFGSIGAGMDCGIREPCCKGTILQRNYRKMTILWSFSYNSFSWQWLRNLVRAATTTPGLSMAWTRLTQPRFRLFVYNKTSFFLFSYTSFVKFHGKKNRNHNMTTFNQNLCYKEMCYKGTALY